MRLSDRGGTLLGFGATALIAVAFEFAVLVNAEPLPVAGPLAATIDRAVDGEHAADHGAPAVSIAIVENGAIAHAYASGLADVASRTEATPATRFRAGSITKMFTAVAVMQLVEEGRVALDDAVGRYLPDAPHANEVTIRHLLSHESGIPNYLDAAFASGIVGKPTTPAAILAPLVSEPLDFPPGTRYAYSNSNYVILGLLVERLRGASLADVVRTRIFAPAAMLQSSFGWNPPDPASATGYDDAAGTKPTQAYDPSWTFGDGDLVTTASDLARFDIALANGKLVAPATFASMQRGGLAIGSSASRYALGLIVTPFGGMTFVGHHGGVPGFEADDDLAANGRFAIVVLGNAGGFATASVENVALGTLDPTDMAAAVAVATRARDAAAATLDPSIEPKLRAFLAAIARGSVDSATLTPALANALTPDAIAHVAATLPPYASLRTLAFRARERSGAISDYVFRADYGDRSVDYAFALDDAGKIAGFHVR